MDDRKFNRMQWRVLIATMIGYTLFYFMRKNFSFAMPGLEQDCGITKSQLGNFLFAGGIVYGISKFLNGFVGDRVNSRKMLCFGLLVCTLVNVAFGFVPQLSALIGGDGADAVRAQVWLFGGLLVVNQFFQGTGFPPCARLIAFWVPPKELATKMSVWNTSHSIGGGLVAKICGVIMGLGTLGALHQGVGLWKWCFWAMAILGGIGLLVMWFWLPGTPEEEGLRVGVATDDSGQPTADERLLTADSRPSSAGKRPSVLKNVFLSPAIWMLGLCNFAINAVRSLVADWGPTMLQEAKGFTASESGTVIMLFEFAGIVGMLASGWATDRLFGGRAPRLCVFLMALTAALFVAFWLVPGAGLASAALIAAGFTLYGPQALTGVTATNLATKSLTGTAIGFISLFSYIGVSVAGKVCGSLAQSYGGWAVPVYTMAGVAVCGTMFFLTLWCAKPYAEEK